MRNTALRSIIREVILAEVESMVDAVASRIEREHTVRAPRVRPASEVPDELTQRRAQQALRRLGMGRT